MGEVLGCCIARDTGSTLKHPAPLPRQYVAKYGCPGEIDGDIFKAAWEAAPWSEAFGEIRGEKDAPQGSSPSKQQETKIKMLWDEKFLYIAALMDVAAGDELVAKFTERNSPIFHTDSDFEVFIDPSGSCHNYKELEMNAINTVWNLMLNRPYSDGGGERSGRVAKEGEQDFWEVHRQRTAARVLKGALHDASSPAQWCCEIALAHSDTVDGCCDSPERLHPQVGSFWNINFSRVEKKGEINWVWTPQIIWSPNDKCYRGQVNMHLPDAWGRVVFAGKDGKLADGSPADKWQDPAFPARHSAMGLYYAAHAFRQKEGRHVGS